MAVDLGYDVIARDILHQIHPKEPEYQESLHLLLQLRVELDENGHCPYTRQLLATDDWRERVKLLYGFFGNCRRLGAAKDHGRPALNDLLEDLQRWFPPIPETFAALSQMLVDNINLEHLLPNFFSLYLKNINIFHPSLIELALWEPLLSLKTEHTPRDNYWKGVALLHRFLAHPPYAEEDLWTAAELIKMAENDWSKPLPFNWQSLHAAAIAWTAKSPILMEHQRSNILLKLKIAVNLKFLTQADVKDYLRATKNPNYKILQKLQAKVREKQDIQLEMAILEKKSSLSHYTNEDLDRHWRLACDCGFHDLAWRTITILYTRDNINQLALHPWSISGENRNEYAFVRPSQKQIMDSFSQLKEDEHKFMLSLIKIGPYLPELLAILDKDSKPHRYSTKDDPGKIQIDKHLDDISWFPKVKRYYRYRDTNMSQANYRLPPFMQLIPNNTFTNLFMSISDRLGIYAWEWKLSKLRLKLDSLIPKLSHTKDMKYSSRVGRWLYKLNPEEKIAWHNLISLSNKLSDDQGINIMATTILRLSTIILPNHYQALKTLRVMRVPIKLIWQIENWILSSTYTGIRKELNTANRVAVPLVLQRLPNIRATSSHSSDALISGAKELEKP